MNIIQILKLAKTIEKFAEVNTEQGLLICNGDLVEGSEVFIEDNDEITPAPDGEYVTEDKVIVVADGKVTEIKDKEVSEPETEPENEPETPAEEPKEEEPAEEKEPEAEPETEPAEEPTNEPDEKDAKIAELEAKIAELEAENAELKNKLGEAEEALSKPVKTDTKLEKEKQTSTLKNYLKH